MFKDRRVEFFPCPVIYMLIFYRPCKCRCPKQHTVDQEARAVGVAVVVGDKIRFPDKIQHQMTRHYPQDQMHLIILEKRPESWPRSVCGMWRRHQRRARLLKDSMQNIPVYPSISF